MSSPNGDTAPGTVTRAQRRKATLILAVVTITWGTTFIVTPDVIGAIDQLRMDRMPADSPLLRPASAAELAAMPDVPRRFVATADWSAILVCVLRFGCVVVMMAIAFRGLFRKLSLRTWIYGFWLGFAFALAFLLQTVGLQRTTPAISAFLTALYVPFTPLIVWVCWRQPPRGTLVLAVLLAFAGVVVMGLGGGSAAEAEAAGLVAGDTGGDAGAIPFIGEILTLLCAVAFAAHIVLTDWTTRREDPVALTFTMVVWATAMSTIPVPFLAGSDALLSTDLPGAVFTDSTVVAGTLYLALVPTLIGFGAMLVFQRYVEASRAGLLYAMEPVHAMWISAAAAREAMLPEKLVGGALIVLGNVVAELRRKRPREDMPSESAMAPAPAESPVSPDAPRVTMPPSASAPRIPATRESTP